MAVPWRGAWPDGCITEALIQATVVPISSTIKHDNGPPVRGEDGLGQLPPVDGGDLVTDSALHAARSLGAKARALPGTSNKVGLS
jgi:hypothetical protein